MQCLSQIRVGQQLEDGFLDRHARAFAARVGNCLAQRFGDSVKLLIFLAILGFVGNLARLGRLPRTRPIVPGELAVSD